MRLPPPHRIAPALTAVVLLVALPYDAASDTAEHPGHARVAEKKPELFGAGCRIRVDGTRVTASCHNPYPGADRVALHIECDPWWDIDTDSAPATVGPAETVRLDGRCWKSVRTAWVSHRKAA
ncbi:hypothetical protein ACIREE_17575 [Streptomyces sp. NPDC102467]|uniref:hypothetical protein n=1 Tax=Streptomyces sp. NPDC102467 TaxID=3366179 RepID=UPI0038183988